MKRVTIVFEIEDYQEDAAKALFDINRCGACPCNDESSSLCDMCMSTSRDACPRVIQKKIEEVEEAKLTQTLRCAGDRCEKYNDDRCCCECDEEDCSSFCGFEPDDYCEHREKLSQPLDTDS